MDENKKQTKIKSKIQNFIENYSDTSTKYFDIYMCITFSFLINGIILIALGSYPAFLNSSSNPARISIGASFIAIWFVSIPLVSLNDKFITHLVHSALTLCGIYVTFFYWLNNATNSYANFCEIIVSIISLLSVAYLLYCLINLARIIFIFVQKLTSIILPAYEKRKSGLLYTLESITSLFLAISSCLAGLWGIMTTVKKIFIK